MNYILNEFEDHHDLLGGFVVLLQQLYMWLQGKTNTASCFLPKLMRVLGLDSSICIQTLKPMVKSFQGFENRIYWYEIEKKQDYSVIVFFFPLSSIETVKDLFFECKALKSVRKVAVKFYKNFELSISSEDANARTNKQKWVKDCGSKYLQSHCWILILNLAGYTERKICV